MPALDVIENVTIQRVAWPLIAVMMVLQDQLSIGDDFFVVEYYVACHAILMCYSGSDSEPSSSAVSSHVSHVLTYGKYRKGRINEKEN